MSREIMSIEIDAYTERSEVLAFADALARKVFLSLYQSDRHNTEIFCHAIAEPILCWIAKDAYGKQENDSKSVYSVFGDFEVVYNGNTATVFKV